MGIETESERGSDEQRITRIGLHVCTAVFSDVIVSSPLHATVLSSPTFIGKSPASIGKPRKAPSGYPGTRSRSIKWANNQRDRRANIIRYSVSCFRAVSMGESCVEVT